MQCEQTAPSKSPALPGWLLVVFTFSYVYFFGIMQTSNPISSSTVWFIKNVVPFFCMVPVVAVLVFCDFTGFKQVLSDSKVMVALCGLALLSCLWSSAPTNTLMESINLTVAAACAFAAAAQLDVEQKMTVITNALLVIAAGSLLICVAVPSIGVMTVEFPGAWRGLFIHKNVLGRMMSFATICGVIGVLHGRTRLRSAALVAMSLVLVLMSRSKSALVLVIVLLSALPYLWLLQKKPVAWRRLTALLLLLVGLGVGWESTQGTLLPFITDTANAAAHSVGKNLSITGRDFIWRICLEAIAEKPMLGHGYGAFWVYPGPVGWIWQATNWRTPHAHNGYIELMLGLGISGMVLYGGVLLTAIKRTLQHVTNVTNWAATWPLVSTAFILISACNESLLTNAVERIWVMQLIWCSNLVIPRNSDL